MAAYTLRVNGKQHVVTGEGDTPLIYFLRNDLALNSPKFGCGLGECGACTVIIDGEAARSCALPLRLAAERDIVTLEGLGSAAAPHALQQKRWTTGRSPIWRAICVSDLRPGSRSGTTSRQP